MTSFDKAQPHGDTAASAGPSFRVLTLNIAHGRSVKTHQGLLRRRTIEYHLARIARLLRRERPHLVALQEADGPSYWSGNFDHVERLAQRAEFGHHFRGDHVSLGGKRGISYGTALLSNGALGQPKSFTFARSSFRWKKGFVVATVHWPGTSDVEVDVVSVHLDFARKTTRHTQALAMVNDLVHHKNPLVVLGDFNCQWESRDDALRFLMRELKLVSHEPASAHLATFASGRKSRRLDWILVSSELRLKRYAVLPDRVSDHLAVLAEIEMAK